MSQALTVHYIYFPIIVEENLFKKTKKRQGGCLLMLLTKCRHEIYFPVILKENFLTEIENKQRKYRLYITNWEFSDTSSILK